MKKSVAMPMIKLYMLYAICYVISGCAAIPLITQAAPLLIDLAGKAFGQKHAETVGKVIDVMSAIGGGGSTTNKQPPGNQPRVNTANTQETYTNPLEVDFSIVKQLGATNSVLAVQDGDVLTPRDNYKVAFSANKSCYVYIFQIDSTTKIDIIWPQEGVRQDVRAGQSAQVPAEDEWFYLDENKGIEHVYFIASLNPILDLESLFKTVRETSWQKQQDVSVYQPVVITRGIGGQRKGAAASITARDGSAHTLDLSRYSTAGQVCITRWFRHE